MDYLETQAVWNTANALGMKPYEVMNVIEFGKQKIEPADFDYTGDVEVNTTTAKYIYYAKMSTFGWWITKGFAPPRLWLWICLRDFSAFCARRLKLEKYDYHNHPDH